jgi:hypothetical protein
MTSRELLRSLCITRPIAGSARLDPAQRRFEIGDKRSKRPVPRTRPRDQHVIGPWPSLMGKNGCRGCPHPPLGAVAGHGITDFSTRREPDPDLPGAGASIGSRCGLQNQTRPDRPAAGRGDAKKISSDLEPFEPSGHSDRCPTRATRSRFRRFRRTAACGPSRDVMPKPFGRLPLPSEPGIRADACERACWAGRCASRRQLRLGHLSSGGGYIVGPLGRVNVRWDATERPKRSRCRA